MKVSASICEGNIFFSRTTLPEPTFLFFALGMMYFVDKWIWEKGRASLYWGFIFTVIAFLIKPWAIFFIPPLILVAVFWRRKWKVVFVAFSVTIFLFGILRTFDARINTTFVKKFAETNFASTLSGYVASEFQNKGSYGQFVFRVKELKVPDFTIPEELNENILVITDSYPRYKFGEKLSLEGKISLPKNYNDFDYISYLAKDQIYTIAYRPSAEVDETLRLGPIETLKVKFFRQIFSFKNKFESAIGMSVKEPHASFLNGILLGSKQNIPQELKDDFNVAGVSHITAISGYNITIVALLVSWFFISKDFIGLPLVMSFTALIAGTFVYYQNTSLAFLFWLCCIV